MKKFSSWLVTHSLNGPLHVRSTMEREIDVATFAPNADGVELKHRSPAGLGEAAARADRGADPPTCARRRTLLTRRPTGGNPTARSTF